MEASHCMPEFLAGKNKPWHVDKVNIGVYRHASVIGTLAGLQRLNCRLLGNKFVRQLGPGQVDAKGNDIGGFFVVSDLGAALLFSTKPNAMRWSQNANIVNPHTAPSIKYCTSKKHIRVSARQIPYDKLTMLGSLAG